MFMDGKPAGVLNIRKNKVTSSTADKDIVKCTVEYSSTASTITGEGRPPPISGQEPVVLKKLTYAKNTLTWSATGGNPNSGELTFAMLTNAGKGKLKVANYVGPEFTGFLFAPNATKPAVANVLGRVNQHNMDPATPEKHDTLNMWANTYASLVKDSGEEWTTGHTLVINGTTASWDGAGIRNHAFTQNILSWTDDDNDTNGSIAFTVSNAPATFVGAQFLGKIWKKDGYKPKDANAFGHLPVPGAARPTDKVNDTVKGADTGVWTVLGHMLTLGMLVQLGIPVLKKIGEYLVMAKDKVIEVGGKLMEKLNAEAEAASEEAEGLAAVSENFKAPVGAEEVRILNGSDVTEEGELVQSDLLGDLRADVDDLPPTPEEFEGLSGEALATAEADTAAVAAETATADVEAAIAEEAAALEEAAAASEAITAETEAALAAEGVATETLVAEDIMALPLEIL